MLRSSHKLDASTQMMIEVLKRNGWVRMPGYPRGEDNVCGLGSRELSKLERAGKIKTFRLDAPNGIYWGIWFVHKPSVESYLKRQGASSESALKTTSAFEEAVRELEAKGVALHVRTDSDAYYDEDWVRLPKGDNTFCGLHRGMLEQLCKMKKIKSVYLKSSQNAMRGVRLIWQSSVREYLDKLSQEQRENNE